VDFLCAGGTTLLRRHFFSDWKTGPLLYLILTCTRLIKADAKAEGLKKIPGCMRP
jgi:hypothetical protein